MPPRRDRDGDVDEQDPDQRGEHDRAKRRSSRRAERVPSLSTARKTISATEVVSASCAMLKTSFAARWRRTNRSAAAAPGAGHERLRREDVQPEHEPDLAEGDRVGFTPELDVDDVGLGEVEDEGERPPGHACGDDRRRLEVPQHMDPKGDPERDQCGVVEPDGREPGDPAPHAGRAFASRRDRHR